MIRNSVDFPTPLRPTRPTLAPEGIATLASSKKRRPHASKTRFSIRSMPGFRSPINSLGDDAAASYPAMQQMQRVIARGASDEAIQFDAAALDCFAPLATAKTYSASTVTTPVTALIAPAICGET